MSAEASKYWPEASSTFEASVSAVLATWVTASATGADGLEASSACRMARIRSLPDITVSVAGDVSAPPEARLFSSPWMPATASLDDSAGLSA